MLPNEIPATLINKLSKAVKVNKVKYIRGLDADYDKSVPYPGEVLKEKFLDAKGISQNRLALEIRVPSRRINEIILGLRGISADTALRLAKFFGNKPDYWTGLQSAYELDVARFELAEELNKIIPLPTEEKRYK